MTQGDVFLEGIYWGKFMFVIYMFTFTLRNQNVFLEDNWNVFNGLSQINRTI